LKNLFEFWKKDIINKLIVIVIVLLLVAAGAFLFMIVNIPGGKSLGGIVSQFITTATPTTDVNAVFTGMAQTAEIELTPAYLRGPATITPIGGGSTATSVFTSTPTPTATSIVLYTSTPSPTLKATMTPTSSGLTIAGVNCIPVGTPKTGQVLDILDGVSARVMIDGLVYTIHYVGVDLPAVAGYAEAASMVNGNLIFQHTVQIFEDPTGNNSFGSQYRYLVVDGKLVNLELIKLGLVSVVDLPSGFACHQVFLEAENAAKAAKVGQWK
jgi:endonuclease YncB( thermonuclease family)